MAILIFFIILQIADGLFTLHGVNAIGIDGYESNPLLIFYMHRFGAVEILFAAKALASLLGYFLYRQKALNALWLSTGFYFCVIYNQILFFIHYNG
ncbi:MAG: hypothetical protein HY505_00555 [Candidatus Yanofskybacteria bacterium]|nr:hypothetical protein [Candidatus Yanofskybacteria bacterium]